MAQVLLVPLVSLHLLLVDIAMAGPLVCVWLQWRPSGPLAEDRAPLMLARLASWALLAGTAMGAILLALRWWMDDRSYFAALAAIPASRFWSGLAELLFSIACMAAYVALWRRCQARLLHRLLAVAAGSNLLVHFPALFAIVAVLSTRAWQLGEPLDRAGYQRLLIDGEVMSRVAHVWLAAFAVAGMTLMVLGWQLGRTRPNYAASQVHITRGAWLSLVASLLQIPAGLYLVFQLPPSAREPLVGGDLLATGLFIVSILSALALMHTLAAIALGDHEGKQIRRAVVALLLVVILMAGTRSRLQAFASRWQDACHAGATNVAEPSRAALRLAEVTFQ